MKTAGARYLELIQRFPLQEISDEETLAAADEMADDLFSRGNSLDDDENAYLDALNILIRSYEKVAHPSTFEKASVPDILRYLMDEHEMSQSEFARVLDIPRTRVSEILNGVRELSKSQIATISDRFKLNPGLFLPKPSKSCVLHGNGPALERVSLKAANIRSSTGAGRKTGTEGERSIKKSKATPAKKSKPGKSKPAR